MNEAAARVCRTAGDRDGTSNGCCSADQDFSFFLYEELPRSKQHNVPCCNTPVQDRANGNETLDEQLFYRQLFHTQGLSCMLHFHRANHFRHLNPVLLVLLRLYKQ